MEKSIQFTTYMIELLNRQVKEFCPNIIISNTGNGTVEYLVNIISQNISSRNSLRKIENKPVRLAYYKEYSINVIELITSDSINILSSSSECKLFCEIINKYKDCYPTTACDSEIELSDSNSDTFTLTKLVKFKYPILVNNKFISTDNVVVGIVDTTSVRFTYTFTNKKNDNLDRCSPFVFVNLIFDSTKEFNSYITDFIDKYILTISDINKSDYIGTQIARKFMFRPLANYNADLSKFKCSINTPSMMSSDDNNFHIYGNKQFLSFVCYDINTITYDVVVKTLIDFIYNYGAIE